MSQPLSANPYKEIVNGDDCTYIRIFKSIIIYIKILYQKIDYYSVVHEFNKKTIQSTRVKQIILSVPTNCFYQVMV